MLELNDIKKDYVSGSTSGEKLSSIEDAVNAKQSEIMLPISRLRIGNWSAS